MEPAKVSAVVRIADERAYVQPSGEAVPVGTPGTVAQTMSGPEKQGALVWWEGFGPAYVEWQYMEQASPLAAGRYLWRTKYRPAAVAVVTSDTTWSQVTIAVVGPLLGVVLGGAVGAVIGGVVGLVAGNAVGLMWRRWRRSGQP